MTIAVALRTNTAAVFAADSKLTTAALAGFDAEGKASFVSQTYDNATKIVADSGNTAMAAVAGTVSLGPISIMDYVASSRMPAWENAEQQNAFVEEFAAGIAKLRAEYWRQAKVEEDAWPLAVMMLALASPVAPEPTVWRIEFKETAPKCQRVLMHPGVWLEGSYAYAFSLLYAFHSDFVTALSKELKVNEQAVGEEAVYEAIQALSVLKPIDKLSLNVMPDQDAIDLAVFLATVQIQMERFMPGNALCGGPIDVMVLKTAPEKSILWFPGKSVRHPFAGKSD